ncbi:hypothetical protein [Streptomyces sp. NPDC051776]|uniref:hypothetical protein n=1 Tax=Streptomyces sp. NPDC051776 TaxID=3155414 RepID=UPI0034215D8C
MHKAMRVPGMMLASLALVGTSATAASAYSPSGADRPGQQAHGGGSHAAPPADEGNRCGNGTESGDGDAQVTVVCGAKGDVHIHNEQGITPSLAEAIGEVIAVANGGGG